ncbi:Fcf2-domain-containing protein [Testicularia cyperi]|uniref:Fcf2-domain-containing protein n=1 Tax=Testicularia cyperi TaxID=1882483 RepID=A0A317XP22_9BASI|nr:Fcf2-domain-containing protein [Testicularia cyperi]
MPMTRSGRQSSPVKVAEPKPRRTRATPASSASSSQAVSQPKQDDSELDLEALLDASEQAYKQRATAQASETSRQATRFEDNQDVISFGDDQEDVKTLKRASSSTRPVSQVAKATKHAQALKSGSTLSAGSIASSSSARSAPSSSRSVQLNKVENQVAAFADGDVVPPSTGKRSKHARTPHTSAGSQWFDMPEFGASPAKLAELKKHSAADAGHAKTTGGDARLASAEQLRKEVQALRLRNTLDPKRFYRASSRNQTMPKFAQLGKIIASPLEPKAVLSRKERGRTVVEELIRDAEAASYAKRKFSDSQTTHRPHHKSGRKPDRPASKKRKFG